MLSRAEQWSTSLKCKICGSATVVNDTTYFGKRKKPSSKSFGNDIGLSFFHRKLISFTEYLSALFVWRKTAHYISGRRHSIVWLMNFKLTTTKINWTTLYIERIQYEIHITFDHYCRPGQSNKWIHANDFFFSNLKEKKLQMVRIEKLMDAYLPYAEHQCTISI